MTGNRADAYVARPDTAGPHPGVLFLVDAFGVREQTRRMADRIASWGYVVLAPNVFYRSGTAEELEPTESLLTPDGRAAAYAALRPRTRSLTDEALMADLPAYIDALQALPGVTPGPIGITGYCMGGRLALRAATIRPDDVAAVGLFHTGGLVTDTPDSPHLSLADVAATVLAVHADGDRSLPPQAIAQFEHALITAGVTHSTTVYPGAEHGYTMADTSSYNHDAAEYHFTELATLFRRTLPRGG
ncbi:MAG: dienelactone hydrolase family protein [Gordonia sp. (in: high G+C Gram-positive bacteria)]